MECANLLYNGIKKGDICTCVVNLYYIGCFDEYQLRITLLT